MAKQLCFWFLILVSHFSFAQLSTLDSITVYSKAPSNSKLVFLSDCESAKIIANQDIGKKEIFIFLAGGIAPVVYTSDKDFEKEFKVQFVDFGCLSSDCIPVYNQVIFQYLDQTFGKKWRKEIRKDVKGLKIQD